MHIERWIRLAWAVAAGALIEIARALGVDVVVELRVEPTVHRRGEARQRGQKRPTFFCRLPRLPKLASADVLRACLVHGVENGTVGLASGASWNAPNSVLRLAEAVDPSEVQFQPGTWFVRAAAMKALGMA